MAVNLDHILWGAADLEAGCDLIHGLCGIRPAAGGSHPGFGTRNQLLSLGPELFFEVIAPDPAQTAQGRRAVALQALPEPGLHAFCLQSDDLNGFAARARSLGVTASDPVAMSRTRSDGRRLDWRILYLEHPTWDTALPFLIDWQGSPHPAGTSPSGCRMADFTVLHPDAEGLRALYAGLGIEVPVAAAPRPGFLLVLDTPRGRVVLT